jgi:hypothetical protein
MPDDAPELLPAPTSICCAIEPERPAARLLCAFLGSLSGNTLRAYRRDLDDFARWRSAATAEDAIGQLLALPKPIEGWTLTTLREKLVKMGAKVVRHAKYVIFQVAEVAVPRQLFAAILERMGRLRLACGWG